MTLKVACRPAKDKAGELLFDHAGGIIHVVSLSLALICCFAYASMQVLRFVEWELVHMGYVDGAETSTLKAYTGYKIASQPDIKLLN